MEFEQTGSENAVDCSIRIREELNKNCIGLLKSESVFDSDGEFLRFSCTKKIIGATSSISAAIEVLDTVVTVVGVLRNPVLNESNLPCSITITLLRQNGDIPENTSITFPLTKNRSRDDIGLKVNNDNLQKVVEKFGFSLLVKCESNQGEIVWIITIPRLKTLGISVAKRKSSGDTRDNYLRDDIEIEGYRERKIAKVVDVYDITSD